MMDLLYISCSLAICMRLLLYRRTGAHFKRWLSFVAWLLIVATGSFALALITGKTSSQQLPGLLWPALVILCALVLYSGGNVSHLLHLIRTPLCLHSNRATAARK